MLRVWFKTKVGGSWILFTMCAIFLKYYWATVDFIIKVLGEYTRSMETIYLFLMHTGSWGTFFMKYPVSHDTHLKKKLLVVKHLQFKSGAWKPLNNKEKENSS